MARAFANISFTPNVKQIQSDMGSRQNYQQFEVGEKELVKLTETEKQFIQQRDSFYHATVSQTGWPYVQHRGGPVGFIKILDEITIGYADFSGNRQYISVGNLTGDERVCLFFMDYKQQRRLKIWGRARLIDERTEAELIQQLEPKESRAPVERGILITIEAFDWNCPKYITPRYTHDEIRDISAQRHALPSGESEHTYKGNGSIPVVICAVEQITDEVRSYTLRHRDKLNLPSFNAGAHINLPVQLSEGTVTSRSYSLTTVGFQANTYKIAVKLDARGNGGSLAIHQQWQVGTELNIDEPKNYFGLRQDTRPVILIAGGIGITVMLAMAEELTYRHVDFELHYTSASHEKMAFIDQVLALYDKKCHLYFSQEKQASRLDLNKLINSADPQTVFYICGPKSLLQQAQSIADTLSDEQRQRFNFESFN